MYLDNNWAINSEVKELYEKYKDDMFGWSPHSEYDDDKRFYVYIWFTVNEEKIFYIGKGTGYRFNHILWEIKNFENNKRKIKGQRYKILKDKFGIDYRILINGISNFEAEIYEYCMMREYSNQGEVLLNYFDMPNEDDSIAIDKPNIYKDLFYERYLNDYSNPKFDDVLFEILMSSFIIEPYFLDESMYEEYEKIKEWITSMGGIVYKSKCKKVKCVIVFYEYSYDKYLEDHRNGIKVYSYMEVIEFIKKSYFD